MYADAEVKPLQCGDHRVELTPLGTVRACFMKKPRACSIHTKSADLVSALGEVGLPMKGNDNKHFTVPIMQSMLRAHRAAVADAAAAALVVEYDVVRSGTTCCDDELRRSPCQDGRHRLFGKNLKFVQAGKCDGDYHENERPLHLDGTVGRNVARVIH